MKIKTILLVSVAAGAITTGEIAVATPSNGLITDAIAGGDANLFVGTGFDSNRNNTSSNGAQDIIARTDTRPNYGGVKGDLEGSTGGNGRDNDFLASQSVLDADLNVAAQVGTVGYTVESTGDGEINQVLDGDGDRVRLRASQLLKNRQEAEAVDTRWGGGGSGESEVTGYTWSDGDVRSRNDSATLDLSSSVKVTSTVTVKREPVDLD